MSGEANTALFIGSYAMAEQDSIFQYNFNKQNGTIKFLASVGGIENPSYIALSPSSQLLFAVSERKEGNHSQVASFNISHANKPELLSQVSFEGAGACHISIQDYGNFAITANYGGTLAVLPFDTNGKLRQAIQLFKYEGSGANQERQEQPHIHSSIFTPDQKTLFVADLGTDRIYIYHYENADVQPFQPTANRYISLPAGVGPRQMAFHPGGSWLYVLCELTGDLFVFQEKKLDKWLYRYNIGISEIENGAEAGDIKIDQAGKYIYASNRGDVNEIVMFSIDQKSGALQEIQRIPSGGKSPRCLALDPSGKYLLSANEQGNSVTSFQIIPENGQLTYLGVVAEISSPTCLQFLEESIRSSPND